MRNLILAVLLVLGSTPLGVSASAYTAGPELAAKIAGLRCPNISGANEAEIIDIFTPWAPGIQKQILRDIATDKAIRRSEWSADAVSQPDYAEKIVTGRLRFVESDRVRQIFSQHLAPIERTVLTDIQTYGNAVCDVMRVQLAFGRAKVYEPQKSKLENLYPYAMIGQALLTVAGCDVGPINGSIGPESISSWSKVFPGTHLNQLAATGPTWLLKLFELHAVVPTCNDGALALSDTGLSIETFARLYTAHQTILLDISYGDCGEYRSALANYAREINRRPPGALLAKSLDSALGGMKDTLKCIDDEDDPDRLSAVWGMFFKQGLHKSILTATPTDTRLAFAKILLSPIANGPDFARSAVEILRGLAEDLPSAAVLLSWAYETGTGVEIDVHQAKKWRLVARKKSDPDYPWQLNPSGSAYDDQLSPIAIAAHVYWLISDLGFRRGTTSKKTYFGEDLLTMQDYIAPEQFRTLSELAEVYVRHESARSIVKRQVTAFGKFAIATAMLEGHGVAGKNAELGAELMLEASKDGYSAATVRLAQAYELGYGVPPDLGRARTLYEQAARGGQPIANFALGRFYDDALGVPRNLNTADSYYRAALKSLLTPPSRRGPKDQSGSDADSDEWFLLEAADPQSLPSQLHLLRGIQTPFLRSTAYFNSPLGTKLLSDLVAATPMVATHLGRLYLCSECGGSVKPSLAANWFRLGAAHGSIQASYALARLLIQYPELVEKPDEAATLLKAVVADRNSYALEAELLLSTLPGALGRSATRESLRDRVNAGCKKIKGSEISYDADCIDTAHRLATGIVSTDYVKLGYDVLVEWSDKPSEEFSVVPKQARAALVDVLSLYGNFGEALKVLRYPDTNTTKQYTARNQTFSRLILSIAENRGKDLSGDFDALLAALEAQGDTTAGAFRQALAGIQNASDGTPQTASLPMAREAFEAQLVRGGFSQALVNTARALSNALDQSNRRQEALAYELVGLNAQIEMSRAGAVESGPLPTRLIAACQLARSSQRVLKLGFTDVATVLAKEAVNKLQDVRQALAGLPHNFRTCFSDLTSDQYRLLFSLFLGQDRYAEAEVVHRMLKDAEVYEYVGLEQDYVHRAFDKLPLTGLEQEVLSRAFGVKPVLSLRAERYYWLRIRRQQNVISASERLELQALENELRQQDASFRQATDQLLQAVASLAEPTHRRSEEERLLDKLEPVKGVLRRTFGGKAAAVHFVVLPDRMHAILTTRTGQTSYTWWQLDREPFSEDRLNDKIDAMRRSIERRSRDSIDLGQELYNILLRQSSFDRELTSVGAELLFLSLDRRLRYLPFAALRSSEGFLVENFSLVILTEAVRNDMAAAPEAYIPTIAAFGTSGAIDGFDALPNVPAELSAIVKTDDRPGSSGVIKGTSKLDADFTLDAFQDAFVRLPTTGRPATKIIHVASHFQLSDREESSFLLLGEGRRLPVKEIKGNATVYDFGDVDLLTLSACDTAYASAGSGQDLESFATVAQRKGARAVLATLWPVSDKSTATFMEDFYRLQVEQKVPRAMALAMVQRQFIKSDTRTRSDPIHWAPFMLLGNWQ